VRSWARRAPNARASHADLRGTGVITKERCGDRTRVIRECSRRVPIEEEQKGSRFPVHNRPCVWSLYLLKGKIFESGGGRKRIRVHFGRYAIWVRSSRASKATDGTKARNQGISPKGMKIDIDKGTSRRTWRDRRHL